MFDRRKRLQDKSEDDRQKAILYKKVFCSTDGKEVLLDLMNRFYFLKGVPRGEGSSLAEEVLLERGQRMVIEDILGRAHMDLALFDKLLRGEIG